MVLLMITFTQGNLLESRAEALVNTVNTVGVMGKGIALMFKEAFPENFKLYEAACKQNQVRVGHMFVTERAELLGPRWIINFPTKRHWRQPSKIAWIAEGLHDLQRVIIDNNIRSIAVPPLGTGNGGLEWPVVRSRIEEALGALPDVEVIVYEPTVKYQNVAKREGVRNLTPARALVAELIRRYWVLGIECTVLEVHKLAYFLRRNLESYNDDNPLNLRFQANMYGPYALRLTHLLNALDGSYLHCDKRLADAGPFDLIWFEDAQKDYLATYLASAEARRFRRALEATENLIEGFQSPLGMELLATVDWLLNEENVTPSTNEIIKGLREWPGGPQAGARKERLFDKRLVALALARLVQDLDWK